MQRRSWFHAAAVVAMSVLLGVFFVLAIANSQPAWEKPLESPLTWIQWGWFAAVVVLIFLALYCVIRIIAHMRFLE